MEESQRPRLVAAYLLRWLAERGIAGTGVATPVDRLAEALGLDVAGFHPDSRRAGTLGWLEPNEDLIYLRADLAKPVRRFTLAHELGHAVLHRPNGLRALLGAGFADDAALAFDGVADEVCDNADLALAPDLLGAGDELLRPGEAYSARAQREGEANAFASALLLPASRVQAEYPNLASAGAGRRGVVRVLADRFGVSEEVALRRLTALLLSPMSGDADAERSPTFGAAVSRAPSLDPYQRAAAESETPALVVAGPGTGKTSTLVGRVAYLVRERAVPAGRILALTFSNKAAREMRERLSALLSPAADDALVAPALPFVSTIHAFCGDLLRRYGPRVGLRADFRLVSETEGYFLLRRLAGELDLRHYEPLGAPGLHYPTLLAAISRAKDELAGPERYAEAAEEMARRAATPDEREAAERAREVTAVYAAYQGALTERGDPDFGDVVRLAVKLLQEDADVQEDVRGRYQHVLVDEFQDINRAMGVLLRVLAGEDGPLWAVGDADQAIYRFRGASPANLARFDVEYPRAQIHTLRRNYRSLAPILDAAAAVAGAFLDERHGAALEAARGAGPGAVVRLATAADEAGELAGLAEMIRERRGQGRALADQAVLCRTRRHGQKVAAYLNESGIPARLVTPLLEQDVVKDVLAVASLLAESSGSGLLRAGRRPDHPFAHAEARTAIEAARGAQVSPATLLMRGGVEELCGVTPEGARGLATLGEALRELRQAPDVGTGLARYVFSITGMGAELLRGAATGGQEECATAMQVAQLLLLARTFDDQRVGQEEARSGADWAGFLDYIHVVGLLRQEGGGAVDEALAALGDGVRVLTVHGSKGLEFPVVYLPGLADRRFPAQRRAALAPLPPTLDDAESAPDAHLLEEACLFYVAVTRARDELVLSHAARYGRMSYKPSPFLKPIRERLGEQLAVTQWSLPDLPDLPDVVRSVAPGEAPIAEPDAGAPVSNADGDTTPALSPSAIETYTRCPRQYAYKYVYGLRPREVGVATLRRSLHDTLRALEDHRRTPPGGDVTDGGEAHDIPTSLADALNIFERNWSAARSAERREETVEQLELPLPDVEPFEELYRRHGREVVEQAWSRFAADAEPAGQRGAPASEYERTVVVRVGQHDIPVTLDRIERAVGVQAGRAGAAARRGAGADGQPARFVRHRLGRSSRGPDADLRSLFYALAAEQTGGQRRVETLEHNLSTGEMHPVALDARKRTRLTEQLHDALDGIRRGEFAPRPEPSMCQNCPFVLICPS